MDEIPKHLTKAEVFKISTIQRVILMGEFAEANWDAFLKFTTKQLENETISQSQAEKAKQ